MNKAEAIQRLDEGDHGIWSPDEAGRVAMALLNDGDKASRIVVGLTVRMKDDPPYVNLRNPDGILPFDNAKERKHYKALADAVRDSVAYRAMSIMDRAVGDKRTVNREAVRRYAEYAAEGKVRAARYDEGVPYIAGIDVACLAGAICRSLDITSTGATMLGRGSALRCYTKSLREHFGIEKEATA